MIKEIRVEKLVDFLELTDRLRNVQLKGFPFVKIYDDAEIKIESFSPERIEKEIFTPQPTVYRNGFLTRIKELHELFLKKGIDIFNLNGGIDYTAIDENGNETKWTILPPVIEVNPVDFDNEGRLDYSQLIDKQLLETMSKNQHQINIEVKNLNYKEYNGVGRQFFPIICDGSHRLHFAFENNINQNLIVIKTKKAFPYYAAPKPYSTVHVQENRPETGGMDKTHVLKEPAHKLLYRLFPTGGVLSGEVRVEKK